jgi:hypothetical protein
VRHRLTRPLAAGAAAALGLTAVLLTATPAAADHDATIHPGVQTYTAGGQCTANFVFSNGVDTFIGQSAHCAGTGAATSTNGCESGSLPLGTPVEVRGATKPGTLAYSSWLTMQAAGEKDANTCEYNDFALVRLHPDDRGRVSPSIPVLGGPTGIDRDGVTTGERVFSYGNSSLRAGVRQLSPKEGISLGTDGGGWNHPVYTVTPGVPGDSGSAFVDGSGRAIGVLSTLALAPLAGSNGVTDLGRALDYANRVGGAGVQLVQGGPFNGSLPVVRGLLG